MADDDRRTQGDEIDLTPGDDVILDQVWDELDAKWRREEEEQSRNGR